MDDVRKDVKALMGTTTTTPNTPAANTFTPYIVKVIADVLNYRSGPSTSYKINGIIKQNEVYTIVEECNGWGKLKSGAGWISLNYVKKI